MSRIGKPLFKEVGEPRRTTPKTVPVPPVKEPVVEPAQEPVHVRQ